MFHLTPVEALGEAAYGIWLLHCSQHVLCSHLGRMHRENMSSAGPPPCAALKARSGPASFSGLSASTPLWGAGGHQSSLSIFSCVTSAKDTCQLSLPALRPCFCRPPDGWKPRALPMSMALGCLPLPKSETSCLGLCLATQGAVQRQEIPRPGFPEDTSVGCAAPSN